MPKRQRELSPMPIFDPIRLVAFLKARGSKKPQLHANLVWKYLMRTPGATIENLHLMLPCKIPPFLIPAIQLHFVMFTSTFVKQVTSQDGSTTKMLLRLQDGVDIETVIMRHGCTTARRVEGEKRTTICVSSQIGCKMGCKFCATGTMGEIGSLWSGEILEQILMASWKCGVDVRNVVFMGMGEPMNNYDNMKSAVLQLIHRETFCLSPRRITVSTVGIVPKMLSFTDELGQQGVSLALSLHAPNQALRASFVPAARAYPLDKLMNAVDVYILRTQKKILVEYCLMKGMNDGDHDARELGALLETRKDHVLLNLIPYNDTSVDAKYDAPARSDVLAFCRIVKEYGVRSTVRREMGSDVAAACGQLVVDKNSEEQGQEGKEGREGKGEHNEGQHEGQNEGQGGQDRASGGLVDMEDLFSRGGGGGVKQLSRQKLERWEARRGHRAALKRITKSHAEEKGSGGKECHTVGSSTTPMTMTMEDVCSLVDQDVVRDRTYVPREDGRPLFPAM